MSLSLFEILLFPLFLFPALFLPHNRLFFYSLCSFFATLVLVLLLAIDSFVPSIALFTRIGDAFEPMFSFLMNRNEWLESEINHLSCFYALAFLFGGIYFLSYLILKIFFIGSSPYIGTPIRKATRVLEILFFLLTTYVPLFFFLIEIREALPLKDGFFAPLFSMIYPIEA